MARTRSQPLSPGGLKSLDDLPPQRRARRAPKAEVEPAAATAGSDQAPAPLPVPKNSGKIRKSRKKPGTRTTTTTTTTTTTRVTRAQKAKLEAAQTALEAKAEEASVEPLSTPCKAEATPALTKSERVSSCSPLAASPPKEASDPSQGHEPVSSQSQIPPDMDTLQPDTSAPLSSQDSQVAFPSSPRQPPREFFLSGWSPSRGRYYSGPNPYYRFAVWNNASRYLDESAFIQHEHASDAVLSEDAESALETADGAFVSGSVSTSESVACPTQAPSFEEPTPMEVDLPFTEASVADPPSPVRTPETNPECEIVTTVRNPDGHIGLQWLHIKHGRLMPPSSVRQFTGDPMLTRLVAVTPVGGKRPRDDDSPADDEEPSAKRRDLKQLTIAQHKGRQPAPYGQRFSRRFELKTPLPSAAKVGDDDESPIEPSDVTVVQHSSTTQQPPPPATPRSSWSIRAMLSSVPRSLTRLMSSFGDSAENANPESPSPSATTSAVETTTEVADNNNAEPENEVTSSFTDSVPDLVVTDTDVDTDVDTDLDTVPNTATDTTINPPATNTVSKAACIKLSNFGRKKIDTDPPGPNCSNPKLRYRLLPPPYTREVYNEITGNYPNPPRDPAPVSVSPPATEGTDNKDVKTPVKKHKKRKRSPSPDQIPNPPGCSYGIWDKYFYYSDDSDEDEEEEEPSQPEPPKILVTPGKGILRPRKRVRFDVSPQDTPSKLRLQQAMAITNPPTPYRAPATPSRLSREVELDEQSTPSTIATSTSEWVASAPNPTGTYGWFPELYSSSDSEGEDESVEPAKKVESDKKVESEERADSDEPEVLADTFALSWPVLNTYVPVEEYVPDEEEEYVPIECDTDTMVIEQFGREFGQYQNALIA